MDSSVIGKIGVSAVTIYLGADGYLDPHINYDDTIAMWDGCIYVYKSKEAFNNKKYSYRVPVQVKTEEYGNNDFPNETSFPVSVVSLKHYLDDGGVVFFKVLANGQSTKVYLSFLTKDEIEKALADIKSSNQQYKTIRLKEAPEDRKVLLENLKRVYLQKNHERIDLSTLANRNDYKITFSTDSFKQNTDPLEYLATHSVDMMVSIKNIPGEFYVKGNPVELQITQMVNGDVSVGGFCYYKEFKKEYKKEGLYICFGNSLTFRFPYSNEEQEDDTISITIKIHASTIDEMIHELEFIIALQKHKEIVVNSYHLMVPEISCEDGRVEKWSESLVFWKNVKLVFERLHVVSSINPSVFLKKDKDELKTLIQAFVYEKVVFCNEKKDLLYIFDISGTKILVYAKYIQGREYRLYDIYESLASYYVDEKNIRRIAPVQSAILEQKELPSNLYLENMVETYKQYKKKNKLISIRANQDLLNMLKHYDKEKNVRLLEEAYQIASWLKTEKKSAVGSKNVLVLNYLQTVKRMKGSFDTDEIELLYKMKTNVNVENFARYILLGDKNRATRYLEMIPEAEKAILKTLPIYHFMNE